MRRRRPRDAAASAVILGYGLGYSCISYTFYCKYNYYNDKKGSQRAVCMWENKYNGYCSKQYVLSLLHPVSIYLPNIPDIPLI